MATHFERQLEELHVQIITMGSLCEKAISLSNRAIRGDKCIQEIFDTDKEIDTKEREIENLCMRILLHQQPVARDLRRISAALKMITDMERIGDQTSDIAEIIMEVSGSEDVAVYIEGCHSCMSARGIKKQNAKTVTTTLRGAFDTDSTLKWHFMMQAGKIRKGEKQNGKTKQGRCGIQRWTRQHNMPFLGKEEI